MERPVCIVFCFVSTCKKANTPCFVLYASIKKPTYCQLLTSFRSSNWMFVDVIYWICLLILFYRMSLTCFVWILYFINISSSKADAFSLFFKFSIHAIRKKHRQQQRNGELVAKFKDEYEAEVKKNEGKTKYDAKRKHVPIKPSTGYVAKAVQHFYSDMKNAKRQLSLYHALTTWSSYETPLLMPLESQEDLVLVLRSE